jgi:peptide/nickel transport system substrate-binding protein
MDPKVVNDRAYEGKAPAGSELFQKDFPWYQNIPGPKYDLAEAKRLVQEAKAAGWNGKIRVLTANDPQQLPVGQSVVTMLQAAGFDVEWQNDKDVSGFVTQMVVNKDFDLAASSQYGFTYNPDNIYMTLVSTFDPTNPRYGFMSPALQTGIDALRVASTDPERKAAFKTIQETWANEVPTAVLGEIKAAWISAPKLHDVTESDNLVLLDRAWLQK